MIDFTPNQLARLLSHVEEQVAHECPEFRGRSLGMDMDLAYCVASHLSCVKVAMARGWITYEEQSYADTLDFYFLSLGGQLVSPGQITPPGKVRSQALQQVRHAAGSANLPVLSLGVDMELAVPSMLDWRPSTSNGPMEKIVLGALASAQAQLLAGNTSAASGEGGSRRL